MAKFGKALLTVGIIAAVLIVFAISFFIFGMFAFAVLGEWEYFADYVILDGYYPFVNFLFVVDYLALYLGSNFVVALIPGIILTKIAKKKTSEQTANT